MISIVEKCSIEDQIKYYYAGSTKISENRNRIVFLQKQRKEVEEDINSCNIKLKLDIRGVSFDENTVQRSKNIMSPQERALENMFNQLEEQLNEIDIEILMLKKENRDIENKIEEIGNLIKKFDKESQLILELRYRGKQSLDKISSFIKVMDKSTVSRKIEVVIDYIDKWINWDS